MYRGAPRSHPRPKALGFRDPSVNTVEQRRRTKSVLTHYKAGIPAFVDSGLAALTSTHVAVWALNTNSYVWSPERGVEIVSVPATLNPRLRHQEGLFTVSRSPTSSLEEYVEKFKDDEKVPLVRFLVPTSDLWHAVADLEAMGISASRMYPDLLGCATTAKLRYRMRNSGSA